MKTVKGLLIVVVCGICGYCVMAQWVEKGPPMPTVYSTVYGLKQ